MVVVGVVLHGVGALGETLAVLVLALFFLLGLGFLILGLR